MYGFNPPASNQPSAPVTGGPETQDFEKETILIVDDDSLNLRLAQNILKSEHKLAAANSGPAALRYLEKHRPGLILMDINMPGMDGFETVEQIRRNPDTAQIPIIFLTADNNVETEKRCFQSGAVDFVGKPFVPDILLSRVRRTLELRRYQTGLEIIIERQTRRLLEHSRHLSQLQESVILGMANLIENRDGSTGTHVKNTQAYVRMIVEKLRADKTFPELADGQYCENIVNAAPLHDIGKIRIPDRILLKPGRLTDEEFTAMKHHSRYGAEIIRDIIGDIRDKAYVQTAVDIALCHHERWDGKGYPDGLQGNEIPLAARIMAVADVFDALYAERCYKKPVRPSGSVLAIMEKARGTQFDPDVLDAFSSLAPQLAVYLGETTHEEG